GRVGEGWAEMLYVLRPPPCPSPASGGGDHVASSVGIRGVTEAALLLHLQRQPHRLAGRGRALNRDRCFQIDARLLRRAMDRWRSGGEMIEPGARLVAERAPEIADRPIASAIAAEKRHVDGMLGHVGV